MSQRSMQRASLFSGTLVSDDIRQKFVLSTWRHACSIVPHFKLSHECTSDRACIAPPARRAHASLHCPEDDKRRWVTATVKDGELDDRFAACGFTVHSCTCMALFWHLKNKLGLGHVQIAESEDGFAGGATEPPKRAITGSFRANARSMHGICTWLIDVPSCKVK